MQRLEADIPGKLLWNFTFTFTVYLPILMMEDTMIAGMNLS